MADLQAYLGVRHSALGRLWADRLNEAAARMAGAIGDSHALSGTLSRILAARGVDVSSVEAYLTPRIRDLMPDPAMLMDMDRAVGRIVQAIKTRESVAIFGDYDVDGACSAALLAEYLNAFGLTPRIHIPDRLTEGYGPNAAAIEMLWGEGASLLICVDCGTSGHAPLAHAQSLGMDVLVLDHHQAPETLPDVAALVNPNRLDDLSGLGHLCAAGVVFLTLVAVNRALREAHNVPDLMTALDLVALATVADVVPLTGLNRAFVAQGLKVMRSRNRPGLAALADVSRLQEAPEAWHLGFLLGPRINAGGRIGDAALGAHLLLAPDREGAQPIAEQLDQLNRERQAVEEGMLAEAEEEALRQLGMEAEASEKPILIVSGESWHPGIVGIIAGRLKERFRRPAFAFALTEEGATGSGRSILGVDLGVIVRRAVEAGKAIKGGGHAMAAGVTLAPDSLQAFADFITAQLGQNLSALRGEDALLFDAALTAESLTVAFFNDIARAAPFGQGNPEPLFALPSHQLVDVMTLKGGHIKAILASTAGARIEAMAFRAEGKPLGEALKAAKGKTVHIAAHLARDSWGGREKVSLRLVDLAIVG